MWRLPWKIIGTSTVRVSVAETACDRRFKYNLKSTLLLLYANEENVNV